MKSEERSYRDGKEIEMKHKNETIKKKKTKKKKKKKKRKPIKQRMKRGTPKK